jgi:hypothetical protein
LRYGTEPIATGSGGAATGSPATTPFTTGRPGR